MKKSLCLVLVSCCVAIVSAQERVLEKAEFEALVAEGGIHPFRWKDEKYRMTVTSSSKLIGRRQTDWASKMVVEFGPGKETRTVSTSSYGGSAYPTKETLTLGNWIYSRTGNDPWTRKEKAPVGAATKGEESTLKVLSSQVEYRFAGQSSLRNSLAHVYVKTERQTKYNEKNGETFETDTRTTFWIDAAGMIIKQEFKAETRGKFTSQTSVIFEWMLDPSITFTAPEVVP